MGTRAFYRHYTSKEALVLAVFAQAAEEEEERLRDRMRNADDAIGAVTAWIEARLDLAFDEETAASMRVLSLEALVASQRAPQKLSPAFDCVC